MILKEKQLQSNQIKEGSYNDYLRKYRAARMKFNQRVIDFELVLWYNNIT